MILFIDTLSPQNYLALYSEQKKIQAFTTFIPQEHASIQFIDAWKKLLAWNHLSYKDITHIIVVHGPWSFTTIRSTIIFVNTLNRIIQKAITPLTYFDLFENLPIVKKISKHEVFIQKHPKTIEVCTYSDAYAYLLASSISRIFWDVVFDSIITESIPNYPSLLENLHLASYTRISPFYGKNPSIS